MKRIAFGVGLAAVVSVAAAAASGWDANGDGVVDDNEIATLLQSREAAFKAADRNGDGFVDLAELTARLGGNAERAYVVMSMVIDNNGDKQATAVEWAIADDLHVRAAVFKKCDADKDGALRGGEIACAEAQAWW